LLRRSHLAAAHRSRSRTAVARRPRSRRQAAGALQRARLGGALARGLGIWDAIGGTSGELHANARSPLAVNIAMYVLSRTTRTNQVHAPYLILLRALIATPISRYPGWRPPTCPECGPAAGGSLLGCALRSQSALRFAREMPGASDSGLAVAASGLLACLALLAGRSSRLLSRGARKHGRARVVVLGGHVQSMLSRRLTGCRGATRATRRSSDCAKARERALRAGLRRRRPPAVEPRTAVSRERSRHCPRCARHIGRL